MLAHKQIEDVIGGYIFYGLIRVRMTAAKQVLALQSDLTLQGKRGHFEIAYQNL